MSWVKTADTKALPIVTFELLYHDEVVTKDFVYDTRLEEYRPVDNPGESYTMDQIDEMIEAAAVKGEANQGPDIQDDDYVITVSGQLGGTYECAKIGFSSAEMYDMMVAIAKDMEKNQFFPNVFFVNDHGNTDLLALDIKDNDLTFRVVQSWV